MEGNEEENEWPETNDPGISLLEDSNGQRCVRRKSKSEKPQTASEQQPDAAELLSQARSPLSQDTQASSPKAESQLLDPSLSQTKASEEGSGTRLSFVVDNNEVARRPIAGNTLNTSDYSGFEKFVVESTKRYEIARETIIEIAQSDVKKAYNSLLNNFDSMLKEKIELDARFVERLSAYEKVCTNLSAQQQTNSELTTRIEDLESHKRKLCSDIDNRDAHIFEQEVELKDLQQKLETRPVMLTIEPGLTHNDFRLLQEENEALHAAKALHTEDLMSQDEKWQREFDAIMHFMESAAAREACLTQEISYAITSTLGRTVQDHFEAFFDIDGHPTDLALAVLILWRKKCFPKIDHYVKSIVLPFDNFSKLQEAEDSNSTILGPDDRSELRNAIHQQESMHLFENLRKETHEPKLQRWPSHLGFETSLTDVDKLQVINHAIRTDMQPTVKMNPHTDPGQNILDQPIRMGDNGPDLEESHKVLDVYPSLVRRLTSDTSEADNGRNKEQVEQSTHKTVTDTFIDAPMYSTTDAELDFPSISFPLSEHEEGNGLIVCNNGKASDTGLDISSPKNGLPQMAVSDTASPLDESSGPAYEACHLSPQAQYPSPYAGVSRANSPGSTAPTEFSGEPSLTYSTSTASDHFPSTPSSLRSTALVKILSTSSWNDDYLFKPEYSEAYSALVKETGFDENEPTSPAAQLMTSYCAFEQPEGETAPVSKDDSEQATSSFEQNPSVDQSLPRDTAAIAARNVSGPTLELPREMEHRNVIESSEHDQKLLDQELSSQRRRSGFSPRSSIKKHGGFHTIPRPFLAGTQLHGLGITPMPEIVMSSVIAASDRNIARSEVKDDAFQTVDHFQSTASSSESAQTESSTSPNNSEYSIYSQAPSEASNQSKQQAESARVEPVKSMVVWGPSSSNPETATQSYTKDNIQPDLSNSAGLSGEITTSARQLSEESTTEPLFNTQAGNVARTDLSPQGKSVISDSLLLSEQRAPSISALVTNSPSIKASPQSISEMGSISKGPGLRKIFKKSSVDGRVMLPDIQSPPSPYRKSLSSTGSDTLSRQLSVEISRWTETWPISELTAHDRGEQNLEHVSMAEAKIVKSKPNSTQSVEHNITDIGGAGNSIVKVAENRLQQPAITPNSEIDSLKGIPTMSVDTVIVHSNNASSLPAGISSAVSSPASHTSPGLRKRRESKSPTTASSSPLADRQTYLSNSDTKKQRTEHANCTQDVQGANSLWVTIILLVVISSVVTWYHVLQTMSSLFDFITTVRRILNVLLSAVQFRVCRILRAISRQFSKQGNALSDNLGIRALISLETNPSWKPILGRVVLFLCWSMSLWFLMATYQLRAEWNHGNSIRARRMVPKWNNELWKFSPIAHLENTFFDALDHYVKPLTDFT